MDIEQLKSFIEIINSKSFRKAAENLHVTQSTISSRIKKLEEELGVSLFNRLGHLGIQLSPSGKILHPYIQQALDSIQQGMLQLSQQHTVSTKILLSSVNPFANLILPQLLIDIRNIYPNLEIDVIRETGYSDEILEMVIDGKIDIAIVNGEPDQYKYFHKDLVVCPIYQDNLLILAHPTHPLAQRQEIPLSMFNNETFVQMGRNTSITKLCRKYFSTYQIHPVREFEINNIAIIKRLVEAERFLCILPRLVVHQELLSNKLKVLNPVPNPFPPLITFLCFRKNQIGDGFLQTLKKIIVDILLELKLPCLCLLLNG